jgi:transcriptional regulator
MLIHPWDAAESEEWRPFAVAQGFGHLVAGGAGRRRPVIVPTQYVLDGDTVLIHLARPNPIWPALDENPYVVLSIAGDWSYIPSSWRAIDDEDPAAGIPTTFYGAVQLSGTAEVIDAPEAKLALLRRQLAHLQPDEGNVDPSEHSRRLPGIRGIRIPIEDVQAKFKYGGNTDEAHRLAVADRLEHRDQPGDKAARAHLLRRLDANHRRDAAECPRQ